MATSGAFVARAVAVPACWLNTMQARSNAAVTGANHPKGTAVPAGAAGRRRPNSRRSILGDGRRGVQEPNWASSSFMSLFSEAFALLFIIHSHQRGSQFLQSITI